MTHRPKIILDVASRNNEYGEENQKNIIAYCQENNINLPLYFRQDDWALRLGEGWFIPGNYELELFNKYFAEGVGKKYKFSPFSQEPILKNSQIRTKEWKYTGGMTIYPYEIIRSSTIVKSAWSEDKNNKDKIAPLTEPHCYYILCQLNNFEGYWWMFLDDIVGGISSSVPFDEFYVAFKRF